uniref:ISXO2-like transposase domain-containing protein n=1 Tax=Ascaris lumbricoides TaxID=6252 RepID=A0A9J2Q106_ASCLU
MSRWSIVDPAVVVPAGAVEEILRELRITYFEMPHLFGDAASAVEFAARYRLVANERTCPKCGGMMKLWRRKCTDSIEWHCTRTAVNSSRDQGRVRKKSRIRCCALSIRHGSVFEKSRLPIETILTIMFLWSQNAPRDVICYNTDIAEHTAVDWEMFIREICADYVQKKQAPLGGPGKVVEIDESVFCRREYNHDAVREHTWTFVAVERGTANAVFFTVPDRTKTTLEALISRWVRPGSVIVSDAWAAYNGLQAIGYTHYTVNHKRKFAHTVMHNGEPFRVHINTINGLWSHAKRKFDLMYETSRAEFNTYLSEFLFRRMTRMHTFPSLMDAAGRLYNPY